MFFQFVLKIIFKIVPEGLRNILIQIKIRYRNPPVYILENGVSDTGTFFDTQRIEYLYSYMLEMLIAMKVNCCNVKAYTIWSLLDNFEWDQGYRSILLRNVVIIF